MEIAMESEDEQEAETAQMAQAPAGSIEVAAKSWVQRTGRHCKEWFFHPKFRWLCLVVGILITAVLVVVIILLAVKSVPAPAQCLEEWIGYRNKCYFISDGEENWTSSQTFCAERESLLVVFENKDEMCSLAKVLKIDDSWIGLRKRSEGFYWENGVALEDSFQIQNHSECAYLDGFTISTSACSLPRRCICMRSLKG